MEQIEIDDIKEDDGIKEALAEKPEEYRRHYVRYEVLVEVDGGLTEEYTVFDRKIHRGLWEDETQYYNDYEVANQFILEKEMAMVDILMFGIEEVEYVR